MEVVIWNQACRFKHYILTFNLYLVSLERKHFIQFLVDATFCKLLKIAHKLQKQEKVKFLKVLD